jgi:YebC/PmpR family DNA-binding regulatory protein
MEGENVEEVRYEGYGPGGIAVMVECMTNNRNRTVGEVRHAFSKNGGNLGTDGSVAYLFKKQGQILFASGVDEERLMEHALELGVEDVIMQDDHSVEVLTTPDSFGMIKDALRKAGFQFEQAEVVLRAETSVIIHDQETAEKMLNLIEALEDLDDVQSVFSNGDIDEAVLKALS